MRYEDLHRFMALSCTDPVYVDIVLVLFPFPCFSVSFHALLSQSMMFAVREQSSASKPRLSEYKLGSFIPEWCHKNYII